MQTIILEIIPAVQAILKILQALAVGVGAVIVILAVGLMSIITLLLLAIQSIMIKIQKKKKKLQQQR